MSQVIVTNHLTLDGVMQAPAGPDEDRRRGFAHGGWAAAGTDEVMARVMGEGMAREGALLFGRWTYEKFFTSWAGRTDNPFTPVLESRRKYVASTTLSEPLPWINSILLPRDAVDAVARLKQQGDVRLSILGSGVLIDSLMRRDLIDEYVLLIHPLVLGSGRRLFPDGAQATLRLVDSVTTTTGVIIATYRPVRTRARPVSRSSPARSRTG